MGNSVLNTCNKDFYILIDTGDTKKWLHGAYKKARLIVLKS